MSKTKPEPCTPEFLTAIRKALEYLPEAGVLRWRDNGSRAGVGTDVGGMAVLFQGRRYFSEQLAWLMHMGECLESRDVGFRNGINVDLRIGNLFDARSQCEVTVARCGDLFVLRNAGEQVMVSACVDEVMSVAKDVLGTTVASMQGT